MVKRKYTIDDLNSLKPKESFLTPICYVKNTPFKIRDRKGLMCKCVCGLNTYVSVERFIKGRIKSCGCQGKGKMLHGLINHPLYSKWKGMKMRCNYNKMAGFDRYGGRGIKVCKEWNDNFYPFYLWAKDKWSKGLELDRIDNNGDYEPNNCRFVSRLENSRNRAVSIFIEYENKRMSAEEWAKYLGISPCTIRQRLKRGLETKFVLSTKKFSKWDNL
jgi:hypothetical protein